MTKDAFKVLVVDDDLTYAETCAKVIGGAGFEVAAVGSAAEALAALESGPHVGLVLTDLKMPGADGMQLLRAIKRRDVTVEVIVMTGYGSIESAVGAIKEDAFDYITKPFDKDELLNAVDRVYRVWELQSEVQRLRQVIDGCLDLEGYVFKNDVMAGVYDRARSAASCDCSVLITGESGTGKEVMARAIHRSGKRANGPFVPINCGALPGDLIESELFGYQKGAFTGADHDRTGLFKSADGGTLFLDEIVEMKITTQSKLLRSIQEHSVRPVGSVQETPVNVRFIAATNLDVRAALSQRLLREDLFHRLNVITIEMPPLRLMKDEIPDLLMHLLSRGNRKHSRAIERFSERALEDLTRYHWPGNIREADNLLERLLATMRGSVVEQSDLPPEIRAVAGHKDAQQEFVPSLSQAEHELVARALRVTGGNKTRAASLLGISRPRLYKMIEQYGIRGS